MELSKRSKGDATKVFETSNVDFGAFLMQEGVKYIGCRSEIDPTKRRTIAVMQFLDEKMVARDLERVFMTSSERRYRELTKYLLKEVHKEIKKLNGQNSEG